MTAYHVTKPARKDPSSLRVIRSFENFRDALRWVERYIYKDDVKMFIDDQKGTRLAPVTYDDVAPLTVVSEVGSHILETEESNVTTS